MKTTKNFFLSLVGMEMGAAIEKLGHWWKVETSDHNAFTATGRITFQRTPCGFLELRTEYGAGGEFVTHETHNKWAEYLQERAEKYNTKH